MQIPSYECEWAKDFTKKNFNEIDLIGGWCVSLILFKNANLTISWHALYWTPLPLSRDFVCNCTPITFNFEETSNSFSTLQKALENYIK